MANEQSQSRCIVRSLIHPKTRSAITATGIRLTIAARTSRICTLWSTLSTIRFIDTTTKRTESEVKK